jgi:ComEC/Rec2-related protein
MHLLVISGMQISLLFMVVVLFFTLMGKILSVLTFASWRRSIEHYAPLGALGVILLYVYLIGMEDASFRAFIAICTAVAGRRSGFKVGVLQVTLSMVILSFLFHPLCIFDLSFQLTVGALLGISLGLFASGGISAVPWRSSLCATMGATSMTSLICLVHFQIIATWGLFYNVLFAWPVSLISCTVGIPALLIDSLIGKTIFSYISAGGLQLVTGALEWISEVLPFQSNQTFGLAISLMVLTFLISQSIMRIRER